MYLFSFFIFPILVLYYLSIAIKNTEQLNYIKERMLVPIFSFVLAIIVCGIDAFFVFESSYCGENIFLYSLRYWFSLIIVPSLFYFFYILFSKDSWVDRVNTYFIFIVPFYAVYMPFKIMSYNSDSFFIAFIKPILCVSCVYIIFFEIKNIYECVINKSYKVVLFGILLLVESLFPFFIEAMWFYSYNFFIWFVLSIIYVLYFATKTRRFSPEYWLNELKRVFKTK